MHEAADSIVVYGVSTATAKVILHVLSVAGASNAALTLKSYVLGCKMVKRRIPLQSLLDENSKRDSDLI